MRVLFLLIVAAAGLSACKNHEIHDSTANTAENLTAENIVSNDVTAIDAVTGDAANMAADVDMNYSSNIDENDVAQQSNQPAKVRKAAPKSSRAQAPSATAEPTATTAENQL